MIKVWSLFTRVMHWALVSAFIVAFYTRNSELNRDIHVDAGYVASAVILLRWLYGFLMHDFASFRRFPPNIVAGLTYLYQVIRGKAKRYIGHNPAGALAIYSMLLLGTFTIITGYMSYNDIPFPFNLVDEEKVKDFHNFVAYTWLVVIGVHVAGVVVSSLSHKENLPLAMITGKKQRRLVAAKTLAPTHSILTEQVMLTDTERIQYIEEAAYYIAESHGFRVGNDWDIWLQAEREINRKIQQI